MAGKKFNSNDPAANAIAVKRSGQRTAKLQQRIKVTKWILLVLLLFVIILYLLFIFFWRGGLGGDSGGEPDYGDFTVQIDEGQRNLISLSEDIDFKGATIRLQGSSLDDMWHCTRDWIPADIQDQSEGGEHHASISDDAFNNNMFLNEESAAGEFPAEVPSYFAYTYYVKNWSDQDIKYMYDFVLVDKYISKEADALDAIRVMIIRNGEKIVWAKDSINGDPLEDNTEIFNQEPYLIQKIDNTLKAGEIDKFTVVMWFEGWDPECTNDIQSNNLKFEMNFEVQNKVKESVEDTTEAT